MDCDIYLMWGLDDREQGGKPMRRYFVRKGLCLALAAALLALSGCGEGAGQTRENPSGVDCETGIPVFIGVVMHVDVQ